MKEGAQTLPLFDHFELGAMELSFTWSVAFPLNLLHNEELVSSNVPASTSDEDISFLPSLDILTDRCCKESRTTTNVGQVEINFWEFDFDKLTFVRPCSTWEVHMLSPDPPQLSLGKIVIGPCDHDNPHL
jgi:hypothetical protein